MSLSHSEPTRLSAAVFTLKTTLLKASRMLSDVSSSPVKKHHFNPDATDLPVVSHSHSNLWSKDNPSETDLTAGKVQNLRVACKRLDGLYIPANQTFSFWKQIGRTTKPKGYVVGRELREGCIIPTIGGGLCQLSNALYDAALKAGLQIVERHAHSQVIPGSLSEINRDATVYWNYVDLRFVAPFDLLIQAKLDKDQLTVTFRGQMRGLLPESPQQTPIKEAPAIGNCFSCNVTSCFRNAPQTPDSIRFGKTAALVDAVTPEFKSFLSGRIGAGDYLFTPIHHQKFASYQWESPDGVLRKQSPLTTIRRSYALRSIPKQGRALQETLLKFDQTLADSYAKKLDYTVSHLIISINLLPHLWKSGILGGRTFDVLAHRSPLEQIQNQLNEAYYNHPESTTLGDFRGDQKLVDLENEALRHANRIITPHQHIAGQFENSLILDWDRPESLAAQTHHSPVRKIFFPASALGRKGIYELAEAIRGKNIELLILGGANEGTSCPLSDINWRRASLTEMQECDLVVLPAYVEHSPRVLLRALSMLIPVIATAACGLPAQQNLTLLDSPRNLVREIEKFLH